MIAKLAYSVSGIYIFYLSYGIFQEKIFKFRDDNGNRFSATLFLLCVQCFANAAVARLAIMFSKTTKSIPSKPFAFTAATYLGAMLCSNEALKYVSYPTQALGKSCKMIPVMLMGVVISGRRYSLAEYICVAVLTLGITVFQLGKATSGKSEKENSVYGLSLLFFSLALDGITGPKQDQLTAKYHPSVHQQMFYTNFWAFLYTLVACILTSQGMEGLSFCINNPTILQSIFAFSIFSALGQNFIFYTVQTFSALTCTTITTTRKFFTILCSVIWFRHSLSWESWSGVFLVFSSLGYELSSKYLRYQKKNTLKKIE